MSMSNETRGRVKAVFEPIALFFGRLGLTPDALTLIGFGITVVGAVLLGLQAWLVGGIVVFVGGVFDMFDGTLARATGQVSRLGAFMDSVFDRWGEALVYVGIVAGLAAAGWPWGPFLAAFAMGSAFLVSYARAKSEGLGFSAGTGMAAVGIMPREMRLVILCAGLVIGALVGTEGRSIDMLPMKQTPAGILVIDLALAIIGIGATITVIQRVLHTRAQARALPPTAPPPAPDVPAPASREAGERAI